MSKIALCAMTLLLAACGGGAAEVHPAHVETVAKPRSDAQVVPKACASGDFARCKAACDGGAGQACTILGSMTRDDRTDPNLAAAAALYERGCNAGDPEGCRYLAYAFEEGYGVTKDEARATALFAKAYAAHRAACDRGRAEACYTLGFMTASGLGTPADEARGKELRSHAIDLYERACDAGEAAACHEVGEAFSSGVGRPRDKARALEIHRKACAAGGVEGCFELALHYAFDPSDKDLAKAFELTSAACAKGSARACSFAGEAAAKGEGAPRDPKRAYELLVRACEGPGDARFGVSCDAAAELAPDATRATALHALACRLGYMNGCDAYAEALRDGKGTTADPTKSVAMFVAACNDGVGLPRSCNEAAFAYSTGAGVERDDRKAASLFKIACDKQVRAACTNLGELAYAHRGGLSLADDKVVELFRAGCDGGIAVGCNDLAMMTFQGRGTKRDPSAARALFDRACKSGLANACENLQKLGR